MSSIGTSYDDKVEIAVNGSIAISWYGAWAYFDLTGNMYSNDLFFALPANQPGVKY
jgi:hypothetical protein